MAPDKILSVLGWICVINYGFLIIWWFMYMTAADSMYNIHSKWFLMSRERYNAIHFSYMAMLKILTFIFFLAPYLALRIVG